MREEHHLSRKQKYRRRRRRRSLKAAAAVLIVIGLGLGIYYALIDPYQQRHDVKAPLDSPLPGHDADSADPIKTVHELEQPADSDQKTGGKDGNETGQTDMSGSDPSAEDAVVTLSFVGDVLLGSTVNLLLEEHGYDYPYRHMKSILSRSDFTMANLETPITDRGEPVEKLYAYRSDPKVLPAFKEAGFDIVNLANNHILDYHVVGLVDTFRHLREAGIHYVGAGENADEAFTPVIVEKNGIRVAVLGFSRVVPDGWWKADDNRPGVAPTYNYTRPVRAIQEAAEQADLVVVLAHWGDEREDEPNEHQIELARRYVDAGADLVIGSHPHVLQGLEHYNGKWIAYSLGNFIFTTRDDAPKTWDSGVLEAACDKEGNCDLTFVPVFTKWAQPKPMDGKEAAALIQRLNELSIDAEIDADGRVRPISHDEREA